MEMVSPKHPSKPDKAIIHQNDVSLLDFLKGHFEFSTDVKLATYLDLTRHAVYKVRAGDVALGNAVRLHLLEISGQFRQFIPLPDLSAKSLLDEIKNRLAGAAKPEKPSVADHIISDAELLAWFKQYIAATTDEAVAGKIGLKRTSLSMLRKGKSKFGIAPRIQIAGVLYPDADIAKLETLINDSGELAEFLVNKKEWLP
ncbi:hypothetical protein [Methylovulum psychrotolerans]|uniref:DNA-binding protein n=1 Tax=Methylovulum psychrotolerans TaxID=1704499 RepID=A0A2S5CIQ6_9GAMM|nr:hypothetical protein [Methylovulum psychrotolerans]POZ50698.1 hypothetical protein AADEFJLK_03595 [Methylovulum psychrotolerans]